MSAAALIATPRKLMQSACFFEQAIQRSRSSVLSGKPIPISLLEVLAPLALQKLGVTVQASRGVREYNSVATTQVPTGLVVNVGQRRITRTIGFNGKVLEYERN